VDSEAAQYDAVLSNNSRPGPDAAAQQIIFEPNHTMIGRCTLRSVSEYEAGDSSMYESQLPE
jgi:hypothetical protein